MCTKKQFFKFLGILFEKTSPDFFGGLQYKKKQSFNIQFSENFSKK